MLAAQQAGVPQQVQPVATNPQAINTAAPIPAQENWTINKMLAKSKRVLSMMHHITKE